MINQCSKHYVAILFIGLLNHPSVTTPQPRFIAFRSIACLGPQKVQRQIVSISDLHYLTSLWAFICKCNTVNAHRIQSKRKRIICFNWENYDLLVGCGFIATAQHTGTDFRNCAINFQIQSLKNIVWKRLLFIFSWKIIYYLLLRLFISNTINHFQRIRLALAVSRISSNSFTFWKVQLRGKVAAIVDILSCKFQANLKENI